MPKKKSQEANLDNIAMKGDVLDVERFVKVNGFKEVSNPLLFNAYNLPTENGLLSYSLFGLPGSVARTEQFGFIDLGEKFITPQVFYNLTRLKAQVKDIIYGDLYGEFKGGNLTAVKEKDLEAKKKLKSVGTGYKFILNNLDKLNLVKDESSARDARMGFIQRTPDSVKYITKCPVIPAMYRDVDFNSRGGNKSVDDVNKLYSALIRNAALLKDGTLATETSKDIVRSKIQTTLVMIYRHYVEKIPKSDGIFQNYVFGKHIDYSGLGVLSAASISGFDKPENLPVNITRSGLPLTQCITYWYIHIERWVYSYMENLLAGAKRVVVVDPKTLKKKIYRVHENALDDFGGDYYKKRAKKYVKSPYTRFDPVTIKVIDDSSGKEINVDIGFITANAAITLNSSTYEDDLKTAYDNKDNVRPLTWTDLFYMASYNCVETPNLVARITRYPLKDHMNTIITYVHVVSTLETKNMTIGGIDYPFYPNIIHDILPEEICTLFGDAIQISSEHNPRLVADHDGDTSTIIPLWSQEAQEEATEFIYSKKNLITLDGKGIMGISVGTLQALSYLSA